jgi:hypothetical protein
MWYALVAGVVLVVVVLVVRRNARTPSLAMWTSITGGIRGLQRIALQHILPGRTGDIRGFDEKALASQAITLQDTVSFVYTVEEEDGGFLHIVSSKLKRDKDKKYQVECMLVVMMELNRILSEVGVVQEDVKFDIEESEVGTQYVAMHLTASQNDQLVAAIMPAA